MQRGRIVRSGDGVGVGKMIGLIVRRMKVGAGVCVGAGVGSGAIVNRQQKIVGAGVGVGAMRQQIGSIVRRMSVGAGVGVGVGAIRQQIGSSVRSNRNVGSGVGVGDATSFSVSDELVNTMRLELGAGVALGSRFVA